MRLLVVCWCTTLVRVDTICVDMVCVGVVRVGVVRVDMVCVGVVCVDMVRVKVMSVLPLCLHSTVYYYNFTSRGIHDLVTNAAVDSGKPCKCS